jgi:hypothetical protein
MNRAINDNALLRDIERFEDVGKIYKTIGVMALSGIGIGCVWFLCVAYRAGVLA